MSIQYDEQEDSATQNLENFLARDEDDSKFEAVRERTSSFPWLGVEKEMGLKGPEEKLEVSGPRRNTIHRRTSLIRSVRIAMESLKIRRKSSDASSPGFQENPADAEGTPNTTLLLPRSFENYEHPDEEKLKLKDSSNTSYTSVSPVRLQSPGEPKDGEKSSRAPSDMPSLMLRSSRMSKIREQFSRTPSIGPSTTERSPRGSRNREKSSKTPSIGPSPTALRGPRESRNHEKLSSLPSVDASPITSRNPRESRGRTNSFRTPSTSVPRTTSKSPREPKDGKKLSKTPSSDVPKTAPQVYRISNQMISLVPPAKNRCRPDCRGPWSNWNHSRQNSQSPNRREGHASRSSQSFDSTEDNRKNID